jgi:CRISPR-associated protein Csd2
VEKSNDKEKTGAARDWMCKKYFDIRTFGAVMTTGKNAGQVRGPVQLTFARSVEPIVALEHSITRMAVATEAEAEKQGGDNRTMGRKFTVPYGLYRAHGFISAHLASQTGFSQEDLDLFWEALVNMFEHDRSAARGLMCSRALVAFEHQSALGNRPAHELFSRVTAERVTEGPARSFSDYKIMLDGEPLKQIFNMVPVTE